MVDRLALIDSYRIDRLERLMHQIAERLGIDVEQPQDATSVGPQLPGAFYTAIDNRLHVLAEQIYAAVTETSSKDAHKYVAAVAEQRGQR